MEIVLHICWQSHCILVVIVVSKAEVDSVQQQEMKELCDTSTSRVVSVYKTEDNRTREQCESFQQKRNSGPFFKSVDPLLAWYDTLTAQRSKMKELDNIEKERKREG